MKETGINKSEIKALLENRILSAMIYEPAEAIKKVFGSISEDYFSDTNKPVFNFLLSQYEKDKELTFSKLATEISFAGFNNLGSILKEHVSLIDLRDEKLLPKLIEVYYSIEAEKKADEVSQKIKVNPVISGILPEILTSFEKIDKDITSVIEKFTPPKTFKTEIKELLITLEKERTGINESEFFFNTIPSLNHLNFKKSNLVTIAGAYKNGKTTIGLNIILDCIQRNISAGIISLEVSKDELNRKYLAMLAGVNPEKIRNPKLLIDSEALKLARTERKINAGDYPLFINDRPTNEIELKSIISKWKERHNIKIILIDYIGLIKSVKKYENREREMSGISVTLKNLAKETDTLIIALAQLNREGLTTPDISKLAESIGLARDSDFLFTVFKPFNLGLIGTATNDNNYNYTENSFVL
jgi:replicative DNA helicase